MLFSEKKNVFMCLVAFQKMFRKIFSDVWLCFWKYHRKHIFYLLLTFSHIFSVAKRIYNIIHSSKHKQNPEKNHQIRTLRVIAIGTKVRSRSAQLALCAIAIDASRDRDRDWRFARLARCQWCRWTISVMSTLSSLSLSLLFSKAGNHLKWKWKRKWFFVVLALIFGQLEILFSLTKFEVTTKHPIFRKIIYGISLKSIQT